MNVTVRICPNCGYWPLNQADRKVCPKCKVIVPVDAGHKVFGKPAWGRRAYLRHKAEEA